MSRKMKRFYKRFRMESMMAMTPKELKKEVLVLRKQVHGLQIINAKLRYSKEV